MRVILAIPTFEPKFRPHEGLEDFYRENFDSYLSPHGGHELLLVLTDFRSSDAFKAFLRKYANDRPGEVVVLDGSTHLGAYQAANVAYRHFEYDIAAFAESDTRARNRDWLTLLLRDFDDEAVVASFATTPVDGSAVIGQTQPGPVDRPSEPVPFPRGAVPILSIFRRDLLAPFGHRLSDVFVNGGCEEGLIWQIRAIGGKAMLNFRCNVGHDRYFEAGRYDRTITEHWSFRLRDEERLLRNAILAWLSVPNTYLRPLRLPVAAPVAAAWRRGGARAALVAAYIRLRQSAPFFVCQQIRSRGFRSYVNQYRDSRMQARRFDDLPERMRIGLVSALYGCAPETYECLEYACHSAAAEA